MELREYQRKFIDDLTQSCADGNRRILGVIPTGGGKTVIAANIVNHAVSNGKFVLFLVHRRELIWQTQDKLEKFGVPHGTMLSGEFWDKSHHVIVGSIQTMHSWCIRRKKEGRPPADLVIVDEAHHATAKSWGEIMSLYPEAVILGLTATPISKGGQGLGAHFDTIVQGPTIGQLMSLGFLTRAKYFVPSIPDLKGIKVQGGDYVEKSLEERMNQPKLVGDIVENWTKLAQGRKTIVFASGVKHSINLSESFNRVGIKSAHVDGKTPKDQRDAIFDDFTTGGLQVLTNCLVATEGVDIPSASCIVLARPTKSLMLYLQICGRGLRPFDGKENMIILDHAGACYEHGPLDQEWDWKLEYLKADKEVREKRAREKKTKSITCGNCSRIYEKQLACPECGWKPEIKGKHVETFEGYLQALDELSRPPLPDKKVWYSQLLGYCVAHQYKEGWAAHKYKVKFGVWPTNMGGVMAHEPGPEVLAFIRHEQIKWAKSKRNPIYKNT